MKGEVVALSRQRKEVTPVGEVLPIMLASDYFASIDFRNGGGDARIALKAGSAFWAHEISSAPENGKLIRIRRETI